MDPRLHWNAFHAQLEQLVCLVECVKHVHLAHTRTRRVTTPHAYLALLVPFLQKRVHHLFLFVNHVPLALLVTRLVKQFVKNVRPERLRLINNLM